MATQKRLDEAYMACAHAMSELSTARRKKVGAILVKDGIIAEGYNGTPSGFDNNCEEGDEVCVHEWFHERRIHNWYCIKCKESIQRERNPDFTTTTVLDLPLVGPNKSIKLTTKPEVLHAETNVIAKVAKSTNSTIGSTLYSTLSPCFECAKLIIQAGIVRVVYGEEYPYSGHTGIARPVGLTLLEKAEIRVDSLDMTGYHRDDEVVRTTSPLA